MASLKTIKNNYGLLTMLERFALFQQAVYRQDETEIRRIKAESPQRSLSAPDFCELPEKVFRLDTVNLLSRLNHCFLFDYFIDAAVKTKDKKESETFNQAASLSAYLYTIETDAWRIVCDELGLNPTYFRELTATMCFPARTMEIKDKFIRDCAFSENEAQICFKQLSERFLDFAHGVIPVEEKIKFYRENIESS